MKSDLLTVLGRFTAKDNRNFELFLGNEYLCPNKNCIQFFRELLRYHPLYSIEQKQKEIIFANIYGNKDYNDSTFRSLVRSLMISLEDFLLIENIKNNKRGREVSLTKIYHDLKIYDITVKKLDEFRASLENQKHGDLSTHYLYMYDYEILSYNLFDSKNKILHEAEADNTFTLINNANNYLTLYYFIEVVSNYVNYRIQQQMFNKHTESLDVMLTTSDLKRLDVMYKFTEHEYAYLLYKYLFLLFSDKSGKSNFIQYKSLLLENAAKLSTKELLHHNNTLITFCIINKSRIPELADELWKLYGFYLKKELYLADSSHYLDSYMFRSIIFLGLKLGYYSDVKDVVEKFSYKLNPEDITNLKDLGYSYYYYYTGDFRKAKEYAGKVKLNDYAYKYDMKNLLVKIHFEEGAFEQLNSILKCYKEFLRNDKLLNDDIKQSFKHFIFYTEHLAKEIDSGNKQELSYLLDKLNKAQNVYSKDWLAKMYKAVCLQEQYANR